MQNQYAVYVTDAPFLAVGDGKTNDRRSIQSAIDHVYSSGGGKVILNEGKTFAVTGIVIKSGVELHFEDGATLLQYQFDSDFVKPVGDSYVNYTPVIGHNYSETIKWSHTWYKNYPFIYAPEGSSGFKITGSGFIRMSECTNPDKLVRSCPIGFYRVSNFEISDITVTNYHGYAMMPFTCKNGLIKNVKIFVWSFGNGDGICLMNCQNIRITGCKMFTGDDSVYIFSSYRDPRASEWWSSDEPQASENIEIDHNDLKSNNCKAFGMILWGIDCPDLEKTEVRNIYVHDNHFKTVGNWLFNPYSSNPAPPPVTGVRFENNIIDGIESNFFETQISDLYGYRSMRVLRNGAFSDGRVFWQFIQNGEALVQIVRENEPYALLSNTQKGCTGIFQGLYIGSEKCSVFVTAESDANPLRIFIREQKTGRTVCEKVFDCTERTRAQLDFTVPESGNYHIGVENCEGSGQYARIYEVEFAGNMETGTGYSRITKNGGKIIYYYD